MRTLRQDIVFGMRLLARNFGVTATVVLSLALGIGANAAIFSVVDAVLFRMLPVRNAEELVLLEDGSFSYPVFLHFRDHNQAFSGLLASAGVIRLSVEVNGQSELAEGQFVSGNYYSVLGTTAIVGRTLTEEDDVPGGHAVAVISHAYWNRRFGLDYSVIGKPISLNGIPFTIVGVTAPEFFGFKPGSSPDISVPIVTQPDIWKDVGSLVDSSRIGWLTVMGRLKSHMTAERARAELDVLYQQILTEAIASSPPDQAPQLTKELATRKVKLTPGSKGLAALRKQFSKPLLVLMTVVGLVLLIACVNVAGLLLARGSARRKEIAVRLGLGASRRRLLQQLMTESMLLAVFGGALGLLFAYWGKELLMSMLFTGSVSTKLDIRLDTRVLGFTGIVSVLTGLLFGLVPAFRATRLDLAPALKGSARSLARVGPRLGIARALVVCQVGLTLILLIAAGLFLRTFQNLNTFYPGFHSQNVLLFSVDPHLIGYPSTRMASLYKQLVERVHTVPGVESASLAWSNPMASIRRTRHISVTGLSPRSDSSDLAVRTIPIGPRYFETLGIPLLRGRDFGLEDSEKARRVAVVNQAMASYYFPNDSPIGKRFELGGSGATEIIGVVRDSKYDNLREEAQRVVYLPFLQDQLSGMTLVVRAVSNPSSLISAIRHEIHTIDNRLPVFDVKTLEQQVDGSMVQERLIATLSGVFGVLALLLASIGLYGIMSYAVVSRTIEIGIRIAIGASQQSVLWMVLRETLILVLAGIVIGLPGALGTGRLISSLLFGLSARDPGTIVTAILVLLIVAGFAGYLPARRASHLNPVRVLHCE